MPLYPLYALLFADTGLSEAAISALLVAWSVSGVVAEIPSGALADRFSRRAALVAAGLLQATGYGLWIALPGVAGFAAGFVLWGVGGALASGAFQALVYDGLAAAGAADRYPTVMGRAEAAGLAVQVPVAGAATGLFALGGYALAGWVSVGTCLAAAALAAALPDARGGGRGEGAAGYLATLATGVREAAGSPGVRGALLAVAVLSGFDALEEYHALLAAGWGVPLEAIPLALLAVPLAGAAGAALGDRAVWLRPSGLALALLAGALALALAGLAAHPSGIVGLVIFFGVWRLVLVVADARLQARVEGPARATVTSVAGVGAELVATAVYAGWALGGLALVTAAALAAAALVPRAALGVRPPR